MSKSSLYDWQKNLLDDPNWVPDHSKDPNISNVFTQKQHEELIEIIDSICESQNVPVTNLLIKEIVRIYYNHLSYHPQPNLQFNASDHYITKLKKLLNYSRRRSHPERRPSSEHLESDCEAGPTGGCRSFTSSLRYLLVSLLRGEF